MDGISLEGRPADGVPDSMPRWQGRRVYHDQITTLHIKPLHIPFICV